MITFDEGNLWFNYRVAGIILDNNRVLLEKAEGWAGWEGWSLPGGRGELLEPAEETLKREMREELGIEVMIIRLLWVVENFYTGHDFHTGNEMSCHELGLYFLVELPGDSRLTEMDEFSGEDSSIRLVFK